jgi:hypothetical protein
MKKLAAMGAVLVALVMFGAGTGCIIITELNSNGWLDYGMVDNYHLWGKYNYYEYEEWAEYQGVTYIPWYYRMHSNYAIKAYEGGAQGKLITILQYTNSVKITYKPIPSAPNVTPGGGDWWWSGECVHGWDSEPTNIKPHGGHCGWVPPSEMEHKWQGGLHLTDPQASNLAYDGYIGTPYEGEQAWFYFPGMTYGTYWPAADLNTEDTSSLMEALSEALVNYGFSIDQLSILQFLVIITGDGVYTIENEAL